MIASEAGNRAAGKECDAGEAREFALGEWASQPQPVGVPVRRR